jgi:hypothetical protein
MRSLDNGNVGHYSNEKGHEPKSIWLNFLTSLTS